MADPLYPALTADQAAHRRRLQLWTQISDVLKAGGTYDLNGLVLRPGDLPKAEENVRIFTLLLKPAPSRIQRFPSRDRKSKPVPAKPKIAARGQLPTRIVFLGDEWEDLVVTLPDRIGDMTPGQVRHNSFLMFAKRRTCVSLRLAGFTLAQTAQIMGYKTGTAIAQHLAKESRIEAHMAAKGRTRFDYFDQSAEDDLRKLARAPDVRLLLDEMAGRKWEKRRMMRLPSQPNVIIEALKAAA